jgi:phenylalanyl-tRNA synthetase beta chain
MLPSRFPSSDVDLAFSLTDSVPAAVLLHAFRDAVGGLAEEVRLFDVYRGPGVAEGCRSLAVRIRLCAEDRTLSDEEISSARTGMISAAEALGATLR